MNKRLLFPLSVLSLVAVISTSCSGSGLKHTTSATNAVYQADINHNGKITDDDKNKTWIETYDELLKQTKSMQSLNEAATKFGIAEDEPKRTSLARYEILHQAEELLMSTNAVVPLYNYADPYMMKDEIKGIYSTNLGYKFFDKLTGKSNNKYTVCVGTKAESFDPGQNSDAATANLLSQVYEGAKHWVRDEKPVGEKEPGVYTAHLDNGAATCTKSLVTSDSKKIGKEGYVDFSTLPDLAGEKAEDYESTARWTITLNKDSKWSDGTPVTADDFIYSWNRSSSAIYNNVEFGMLCGIFDCIRGYDAWNTIGQHEKKEVKDWPESEQKAYKELEKSKGESVMQNLKENYWDKQFDKTGAAGGMLGIMKGEHEGKETITVQLTNDCDYFEELLAYPALYPVKKKNIIIIPDGKNADEYEKEHICEENRSWWLNKNDKFACNGPFKVKGVIDNTDSGGATLIKNSEYRDKTSTTVEQVDFRFIDKDSAVYDSYKSGTLDLIEHVPSSMIQELKKRSDWHVADQIGLFYYIFNVNDNTFDRNKTTSEGINGERNREKYRRILNLLINRHDINENVVKTDVTSADGVVTKGITEKCIPVKIGDKLYAKRTEQTTTEPLKGELVTKDWTSRNLDKSQYWNNSDTGGYRDRWLDKRDPEVGANGGGFYNTFESIKNSTHAPETDRECEEEAMRLNIIEARKLGEELEASGTGLKVVQDHNTGVDPEIDFHFENFPSVSLSTNNGTGLEELAERIQAYYDLFNIDMSISTQEWQSFSATRRTGDFAYARNGWVADYNDPRTYLDLFRSTDGNNDAQLGKDSWHTSH